MFKKNKYSVYILAFIFLPLISCKPAVYHGSSQEREALNPSKTQSLYPQSSTSSKNNPSVDLETEIIATYPWNITFVIKDEKYEERPRNDYWPVAWRGAEAAADDFGVNINLAYIKEPCGNEFQCVEAQVKLILDHLERDQIDAMIIAPMDANRLVPITEKVIDQGIPVVAIDSAINTNKILSLVTFDNFKAGEIMGKWLVNNLDGDSNVLILEGVPNQQNSVDRRNGFFAGLQQGNANILDSKSAGWQMIVAEEITANWLEEFADIDAILSANDAMALGALEAISTAKRDGIIVTGYDAIDDAIEAIRVGNLAATIDQSPALQARIAIQILIRHLETGETFPSQIFMPEIRLISQDNIEEYLVD